MVAAFFIEYIGRMHSTTWLSFFVILRKPGKYLSSGGGSFGAAYGACILFILREVETMQTKLSPNQEEFAKKVALEQMNYSDAYRAAYPKQRMSPKTINEAASRLMTDGKILARIEELRAEIDSPRIMSATKRAERLSDLAENAEDPYVQMKAIDLLNKMTGEYVQKVEANVNNEVTINIELRDDE